MPRTTELLLSCLLAAAATPLAAQAPRGADARADAKADARADGADRSHQSRSSSHRVVVVNGRTIVDERTEDGRPTPGGKAGKAGPAPKAGGAPTPAMPDPEELLRQMRERMRRQLEAALPDRSGPEGELVRDLRERLQRDMDHQIDGEIDRARSGERSSERGSSRSSKRGSHRSGARESGADRGRGGRRPSIDSWKTPVKQQPKAPEPDADSGRLQPRRG